MAGVWCSAMQPGESIGVGTGETVAEGVCRGLHKWLTDELYKQQADQTPLIIPVHLSEVEDDRCRFYLQALTTMQGAPTVGLGEEVSGFPVVWVGTSDGWYGSSGLNVTMALRNALQQALLQAQNKTGVITTQTLQVSSVHLEEEVPQSLVIPAYQAAEHSEVLNSALQILKRNRNQLLVYNLALEPFLKEGLAGVFGVLLREEEAR
jgi:putative thiazole-containing bacteriocin maturation protein